MERQCLDTGSKCRASKFGIRFCPPNSNTASTDSDQNHQQSNILWYRTKPPPGDIALLRSPIQPSQAKKSCRIFSFSKSDNHVLQYVAQSQYATDKHSTQKTIQYTQSNRIQKINIHSKDSAMKWALPSRYIMHFIDASTHEQISNQTQLTS